MPHFVVLLLTTAFSIAFSTAYAGDTNCSPQPLTTDRVDAPNLKKDSFWRYMIGDTDYGGSLSFLVTVNGINTFQDSEGATYREFADTYADLVPSRKGDKILVKFPLALGDSWEDEFTETGEWIEPDEAYTYEYHERSSSKVVAIEEVQVAAGTFTAFRIHRIAHWTKSNPSPVPGSSFERHTESEGGARVDGVTLTQIWYAPEVGRAVLKAWMVAGHDSYASDIDRLLETGHSTAVELQAYDDGNILCTGLTPVKSKFKSKIFPPGFPVMKSSSWEWAFQIRPHVAKSD